MALTLGMADVAKVEEAQGMIARTLRTEVEPKKIEAALVAFAMARLIRNLLKFYKPREQAMLATLIAAFIERREVVIEGESAIHTDVAGFMRDMKKARTH